MSSLESDKQNISLTIKEKIMAFVVAHKFEIVIALLAISEVLAAVPAIKANSVFGLFVGLLKSMVGK